MRMVLTYTMILLYLYTKRTNWRGSLRKFQDQQHAMFTLHGSRYRKKS